jgi:hypothetical protein
VNETKWRLVPTEPTEVQSEAGRRAYKDGGDYDDIYKEMVRWAPTPSTPAASAGGWISVKDRLPEGDDDVLAWFPGVKFPWTAPSKTVRSWMIGEDPIDDGLWQDLPSPPAPRIGG